MVAEQPVPAPGKEPAPGSFRAGRPWRELVLAASVIVLSPQAALLAFAAPLAAFLAALDRGGRRIAAVLAALAIPCFFALQVPSGRFFVVAVVLATASTLLVLRAFPRAGYAEVSIAAFAGLLGAMALWLVLEPGFFAEFGAELEASLVGVWRTALEQAGGGEGLPTEQLMTMERAFADSARVTARLWPAWLFLVLWAGTGAALQLAARWARGTSVSRARVAVGEPFSRFRLPDAWVWVMLGGMAGFLALPGGTAAREAALNAVVIGGCVYACQGLALFVYYLERRGAGPVARAALVLLALLTPIVLVMALGVGLVDVWLDLRARTAGGGSARPDA